MAAEAPESSLLRGPRGPLDLLLRILVALVCLVALGTMLTVPIQSKTVGLVYGGF